jgi:surface-anchored protein
MKNKLLTLLSLLAAGITSSSAALYTGGHADIGIAFEDGAFDLHVHADDATIDGAAVSDVEYEASEVTIQVSSLSVLTSSIDSVGLNSGDTLYYLSQNNPGDSLPFLGIATEELSSLDFPNGVTLSLGAVTGPTNGNFALWETGNLGSMTTHYSSRGDEFTSIANSLSLDAGGHYHYTYGFSQPGAYDIVLTATGTTGGVEYSDSATYSFNVVPEPSTYALIFGLVAIGVSLVRRRA